MVDEFIMVVKLLEPYKSLKNGPSHPSFWLKSQLADGPCYDDSRSEVFKSNLASRKLIFQSLIGRLHYDCVDFIVNCKAKRKSKQLFSSFYFVHQVFYLFLRLWFPVRLINVIALPLKSARFLRGLMLPLKKRMLQCCKCYTTTTRTILFCQKWIENLIA